MIGGIRIIERRRLSDSRGWFIKPIDGNEENLPAYTGEVYVTSALPGQSKGGDYSIKTNKWFTIVVGKADLLLEDINTREKMCITLDADTPKTIYVPCGVANQFVNNYENDFVIVAYADQKYDKNDIVPYKL